MVFESKSKKSFRDDQDTGEALLCWTTTIKRSGSSLGLDHDRVPVTCSTRCVDLGLGVARRC